MKRNVAAAEMALAVTCLAAAGTALAANPLEAARTYREQRAATILHAFVDLLALPNVASDSVGIRRNAAYVAALLSARGAQMQVLELPGAPPIVAGRLEVAGATRTLGLYAHYDGQPADPTEWTSPPWTPTLYTHAPNAGGVVRALPADGEAVDPEWRIVARSSGDDKAPIQALASALDALQAAGLAPRSNLVFLFEGEEEAGSPHLGDYLKAYSKMLTADAWLIFDGPVHPNRQPQLVFGVRGVTTFQVTVYGPVHGLHSGHYGNWAPNPASMLANLVASMKDADGNVVVEGFFDTVEPLSTSERRALDAVPDLDAALREEFGLARTEGTGRLSERLLLPSLNVDGLASAQVGRQARNVIPPTATAAFDIRLVKGNDPDAMVDLVEAHIRKRGYFIVRDDPDLPTRLAHPRIAKVTRGGGYVAARTSMDHPFVELLIAAARQAAGGSLVLLPSLGGSLPLYLFNDIWDVPIVIVPIANHDDNQHTADENLRLANLWYGIDLMACILTMPAE